jgi:hypothetical protein
MILGPGKLKLDKAAQGGEADRRDCVIEESRRRHPIAIRPP